MNKLIKTFERFVNRYSDEIISFTDNDKEFIEEIIKTDSLDNSKDIKESIYSDVDTSLAKFDKYFSITKTQYKELNKLVHGKFYKDLIELDIPEERNDISIYKIKQKIKSNDPIIPAVKEKIKSIYEEDENNIHRYIYDTKYENGYFYIIFKF